MSAGVPCVLMLGRSVPDFKEIFHPKYLPECVFDQEAFSIRDIYKATVREEEDYSHDGDKGFFVKEWPYMMVAVCNVDPFDEEYRELLN